MVDNSIIKQMLEKADAGVFYFGGSDVHKLSAAAGMSDVITALRMPRRCA